MSVLLVMKVITDKNDVTNYFLNYPVSISKKPIKIFSDIFEISVKAQSSKLERLSCHFCVKRDIRTLSLELRALKHIRQCRRRWDRL